LGIKELLDDLVSAITNLETNNVKKLGYRILKLEISPQEILNTLAKGMEIVGEKYENCEYFLSELLVAGNIMQDTLNILEPKLRAVAEEVTGKIVIGTVKGDLHDLGKDIIGIMLKSAGFQIIDLGVDVSTEKFVETVKTERPAILAISALLTSTMMEMEKIIETLRKNNLRHKVKIIIGGRPVTQSFADEIGADAYGKDAVDAIKKVKTLIS
jgi:5-methyltetrahydrofolate--homocysteine methyltransferase